MPCTVLIVDDSSTTRMMIRRTIQVAGLPVDRCLEASDGQNALDLLAAEPVDLVLADLNMPRMSGVEMTRRIRSAPANRQVPIVIVSADPNLSFLHLLEKEGIQGYVRKPFTPEGIRNAVARLLETVHA